MTDLLEGLAPWPSADFSAYGEVETKPMGKIQKIVASFLRRNWVAIPHVTHNEDADITELEIRRKAHNNSQTKKLTIVPLLVKALADGLVAHPQFNASLNPQDGTISYKKYSHVGVAVDTPGGLLVPVIRDCDKKSVADIAEEIVALSEKARTQGLSMAEMSGGCITLTSLGHIGGTSFTPIVNAPEVAILGVTRSRLVPAPDAEGAVTWRLMLPLSLSYDHRVINGADAARFCRFLADRLGSLELSN